MQVPDAIARIDNAWSGTELFFCGNDLRQALRAAHIPVTAERYLSSVHLMLVLALAAFLSLFSLSYFSGYELELFSISTAGPALWILLFCILVPGTYLFRMCYPHVIALGRKNRIGQDLPYAVSYMEALSTTMTPYAMMKKMHGEQDMFGEISREFGIIVRNVEVFGDDLITAMQDLQRSTPSPALRDFLNDLGIVFDSGGDANAFLAAKSRYFREQSEQEQILVLKTIEIMAEVYVSAFVAGPIALIIMIIAQGMTTQNQMDWLLPLMFVAIPAGAIAMIWLLWVIIPPENLEISKSRRTEYDFAESVQESSRDLPAEEAAREEAFFKELEARKRRNRFLSRLRHPFRSYIASYDYSLLLGMLSGGIATLLWLTGSFDTIFPHNTAEAAICIIVIAFMIPVAIAYEGRRWFVKNIESHVPGFLRELSDMKDIGITLHDAIQRISAAKLGLLSSELSLASRDISSGAYVSTALVRMDERIGLVSVKRTISLLVRASEITHNLRQIFLIAITDFEHYLRLKRDRANTTIIYVMIIYLSFGIYLYTAYQLNVPFIASFSGQNIPLDITGNITDMFRIGIMIAVFSGIMAGQFSANSILCGFKHSIVLLAATIITFVLII